MEFFSKIHCERNKKMHKLQQENEGIVTVQEFRGSVIKIHNC